MLRNSEANLSIQHSQVDYCCKRRSCLDSYEPQQNLKSDQHLPQNHCQSSLQYRSSMVHL